MQRMMNETYVSEADYLAGELTSQVKHEYVSGRVFAMAGTSIRHNQIALNVAIALRANAGQCRVTIADVKFKANQLYYYPDVMVSCTPPSDEYSESAPCLVVEVLSESTESIDRGEKLHAYQKNPELQTYLLITQKERRVDVYTRSGSFWRFESLTDASDISLTCPPMKLTLDTIYRDVEVDTVGGADTPLDA
jgi:Uma2 family endonuclease